MADDFAQLVKQQVDIVRIVGEYLKLRKTGAQNYTGLCPFHKEKTGSFSVNATHGYYYCFGCHAKGDGFLSVSEAAQDRRAELHRAVPVPQGEDRLVQRERDPRLLLLLRLPREGRRVPLRRSEERRVGEEGRSRW